MTQRKKERKRRIMLAEKHAFYVLLSNNNLCVPAASWHLWANEANVHSERLGLLWWRVTWAWKQFRDIYNISFSFHIPKLKPNHTVNMRFEQSFLHLFWPQQQNFTPQVNPVWFLHSFNEYVMAAAPPPLTTPSSPCLAVGGHFPL